MNLINVLMYLIVFVTGFLTVFAVDKLLIVYYNFKQNRLKNKEFKRRTKEMEEMLSRGEVHEWVELYIGDTAVLICRKTGWCPTIKGFFNVKDVEYSLKEKEERKLFADFVEKELEKISLNNEIGFDKVNKVYQEILSLPDNFEKTKK